MHKESISADRGMCNNSSYGCNRPLLHTNTDTAIPPPSVSAAQLAVGIGIDPCGIDDTVPGHHNQVARASGDNDIEIEESRCHFDVVSSVQGSGWEQVDVQDILQMPAACAASPVWFEL